MLTIKKTNNTIKEHIHICFFYTYSVTGVWKHNNMEDRKDYLTRLRYSIPSNGGPESKSGSPSTKKAGFWMLPISSSLLPSTFLAHSDSVNHSPTAWSFWLLTLASFSRISDTSKTWLLSEVFTTALSSVY